MGTNGLNGNNSPHIIGSSVLSQSHFSALQGLICDCQLVGSSWLCGLSSVSLSRSQWMCLSKATAIGTTMETLLYMQSCSFLYPSALCALGSWTHSANQPRQMFGSMFVTPEDSSWSEMPGPISGVDETLTFEDLPLFLLWVFYFPFSNRKIWISYF